VTRPTPERASDFLGALGVNIHLSQGAIHATTVISDMAYLGLTKVRDGGPGLNISKSVIAAFGKLANASLKLDWVEGGLPGVAVARIKSFLRAYPGSLVAVEGPNEVNNFAFTFRGLTGAAAAVAYQRVLYNLVHVRAFPAAIPVLNFTDNPVTAGLSDAANGHPYPKSGAQPLATLMATYGALESVTSGKPVYFTEAGYPSLAEPGQAQGVDDVTQAKLTLNLIMDAASLGVVSTYLYDLVDDGPDPTGSDVADHFGLFTLDGAAKPSAVAIHDLTSILADSGARAANFTATPLNDSLTGLPADGESLVIEKSSGVYDLVVWAEPTIWDAVAGRPVIAAPASVAVDLGARFEQVQVFDPLLSASPISAAANTDQVTISLVDHPLVVQVSNFASAMSGIPLAAATPARPATPAAAPALARLAPPGATMI
jgi:hypothetical protein